MRRNVVNFTLASLFVLGLCLGRPCVQAEDTTKKVATAAAEAWLGHVDGENYTEAWREASPYLQRAVTEQAWVKAMSGKRKLLGQVVSRTLKSAQPTEAAPDAPDGNWVVMQFETCFEHEQTTIETVAFMQEQDGKWKAAGYYIGMQLGSAPNGTALRQNHLPAILW